MSVLTVAGWEPGPLAGVWLRQGTFHDDLRGSFIETWRASWTDGLEPGVVGAGPDRGRMVQANISRSRAGVLRGLHCHRRQADLWVVVEGHPFVALVDLRGAIAGTLPPVTATVEAGPGMGLYLPALVAHGFYAPDELILSYLVTNEHDGSDELGCAWDDPTAAVPWPSRTPILSARDAAAPTLQELLAALRA